MNTERWPVDYETLSKGDVIGVERLERITAMKYGTKDYELAILALSKRIEAVMEKMRRPVSTKIEKGCIQILDDPAASDYQHGRCGQALRAIRRGVRRLLQVDSSRLTAEQRERHDVRICIHSRTLQGALLGKRNKIQLSPTVDNRPKLTETMAHVGQAAH
jgi:hypothetical protein